MIKRSEYAIVANNMLFSYRTRTFHVYHAFHDVSL